MPLDSSIYGAIGRGVKSVADYDAEANAAKLNQLQLLGAQSQYAQGQQSIQDQNALRTATQQFGTDAVKNRALVAGTGNYKALQDYDKAQRDAAESASKTALQDAQQLEAKTKSKGFTLDQSIKNHDFQVQKLGALADPSQVTPWIADGVQSGVFSFQQATDMANRFKQAASSPGFDFNAWKSQALQGGVSATDQVKQAQELLRTRETNATSRANNFDTNATSRANNASTVGATIRGQNLVDARTRESTSAALTKPFEVTGADGQPVLVQQDKQGNITPVQGYSPKGGSSKPLNDSQAKALGYGTRMQEADRTINEVGNNYSQAGVNAKNAAGHIPVVGGLAEAGANMMLSDNSQKAEQAQRDFLNAILRRESGAAIANSEFENARKQYFPEPGDSAAKLTQKAANRKLAAEGVMAEVPKGQRGTIGPAATPSNGLNIDPSAIEAELARRTKK